MWDAVGRRDVGQGEGGERGASFATHCAEWLSLDTCLTLLFNVSLLFHLRAPEAYFFYRFLAKISCCYHCADVSASAAVKNGVTTSLWIHNTSRGLD